MRADHIVQLYETDTGLIDAIDSFVGESLRAGGAALIVATQQHRVSFAERVTAGGVDLDAAHEAGRYVALDAETTLSRLLVDGSPDPLLFNLIIGAVVARMLLRWEQVSVFGEMVGLLAGAGNLDGAATLERIWDATQRQLSFPLICSYKVDQFAGCAAVALAEDLCALHSRVVPSESYMSLPDDDARLRTVALLQLKGHRLDQKSRHGDPPIRPHDDDACVITRREHDIVQLVAEGLSNSMIADRLVLSKGTVANHIQHIFRKLELRSRTQIALWAVRHGFNDADDGCAGWAFPPSIQAHADSSEMQLRR